jgi:hypothetical protein
MRDHSDGRALRITWYVESDVKCVHQILRRWTLRGSTHHISCDMLIEAGWLEDVRNHAIPVVILSECPIDTAKTRMGLDQRR